MEQKHTFAVLPFIRQGKQNKDGNVPVYLRITVDGKRIEVSTRTVVDPGKWQPGIGRQKGTTEETRRLNKGIENFEHRAKEIYHRFIEQGKIITPDTVKNELLGLDLTHHSTSSSCEPS